MPGVNSLRRRLALGLCLTVVGPMRDLRAAQATSEAHTCKRALPTLMQLLSAHQRQQGANARQRQLQRVARRARSSAWLPTLTLWAEHRQLDDHASSRAALEPMALKASRGRGQVFRAQLRWQLGELLHHYAVNQALRLARAVHESQARSRQALAKDFGQLQALWWTACERGWSAKDWEKALMLRAQLIARSGLQIPMPSRVATPRRHPRAPGPGARGSQITSPQPTESLGPPKSEPALRSGG